ncbi:MAG: hypothetical protein LBQ12_07875 [Deltaproteobacteria bacterium]|nr:hypothetical protein [Deltaproteobacteria bacterium]
MKNASERVRRWKDRRAGEVGRNAVGPDKEGGVFFLLQTAGISPRKGMMENQLFRTVSVLTCFLFIFAGGCSGGDAALKPTGFGKGETITTKIDSFVLHDVLFAPEYDTPQGDKGYAVVFLKKSDRAPVILNSNNTSVQKSAVDLNLLVGRDFIKSKIISFDRNGDDQNFRGKITIFFQIRSDGGFPKQGILTVEDRGETDSYQVDFYDIEVTGSLESNFPVQSR